MTRHTRTIWTEDQIAQVADLWRAGLTCSQIAAKLGKSRNSVIGKLYRLGLSPNRAEGQFYPVRRPRRSPEPKLAITGPDRTPCPRCGVRADVGCGHVRAPFSFTVVRLVE